MKPAFCAQGGERVPQAAAQPPIPGMEVFPSRTGDLPVPRYFGKTIHSLYDPAGEAGRFVDAFRQRTGIRSGEKLIVLGNGFGYVTEALLHRGIVPIVFEPCRALLSEMGRHRDLPEFLSRTTLYTIDSPRDVFRSGPHRRDLAGAKGVMVLPYINALFPGWGEAFDAAVAAMERSRGAFYRVSVISPLSGGSLEIARYCARAFRDSGFPTDFVDVSGFGAVLPSLRSFHPAEEGSPLTRGMDEFFHWSSRRIFERVERFDPAIVVVLAQAPLSAEHVQRMRGEGRRVVYWFVEDSHLFRYWENDAANYDLYFAIQKGEFLRELETAGQPHHHYLPMAADDTVFRVLDLSPEERKRFGSPLSFMGAGYYNRRRFFNVLLGRPFKIWGNEWPESEPLSRHLQENGRRVDASDTARIFNATEVNINLHSSVSHEGVNPFGDFVNPRTFEIAACSAFQLVDRRRLLPELFVPGEEMVCFSDRKEFLDLVDHFLSHPEDRREHARRAMRRTLSEHTYRHRIREMIEVLYEIHPPEEERRLGTAGELMASPDPEWKTLLAGFPPDRPVDFDAFLAGILEKDPGRPFTRKESLALLIGGLRNGGI